MHSTEVEIAIDSDRSPARPPTQVEVDVPPRKLAVVMFRVTVPAKSGSQKQMFFTEPVDVQRVAGHTRFIGFGQDFPAAGDGNRQQWIRPCSISRPLHSIPQLTSQVGSECGGCRPVFESATPQAR